MVILIAGTSHTGKTVLAQKILEKYKVTYLSIDHLKMGLIRSGNIELTLGNIRFNMDTSTRDTMLQNMASDEKKVLYQLIIEEVVIKDKQVQEIK